VKGSIALLFSLVGVILAQSITLSAANLTVTTTNDGGDGSLRQVIHDAAPRDTIDLAVHGLITLSNGQLLINKDLAIIGPGATNLAISGNLANRVFEIGSNIAVRISGLTISNGRAVGTAGSSSTNSTGGDGSIGAGGGILNAGHLNLAHCVISNNSAMGGDSGAGGPLSGNGGSGAGGALFIAMGSVAVSNCAFIHNLASGAAGRTSSTESWASSGGSGLGGAIHLQTGAIVIANSLLCSNSASGGSGGGGYTQSAAHAGEASGGGIFLSGGTLTLMNTILAGNSGLGGRGGVVAFSVLSFPGSGHGGGISVATGMVAMSNCSLAANWVAGGEGSSAFTQFGSIGGSGADGCGGAVFLRSGAMSMVNSTVSSNAAYGGAGANGYSFQGPIYSGGVGGSGQGGGICSSGKLDLTNCTVTGNSATGANAGSGGGAGCPSGGNGVGGGISSAGAANLTSCTISGNQAVAGSGATCFVQFPPPGHFTNGPAGNAQGGGVYDVQSAVTLWNTIVAANRTNSWPNDVAANVSSLGYNLIGITNDSAGWGANDLTGSLLAPLSAGLSPLRNNGGSTLTMALRPGNPAIDKGDDLLVLAKNLASDQRGLSRKAGAHVDIGAYELQPPVCIGPLLRGTDLTVQFTTEIGQTYRIERIDGLGHGSWESVVDNVAGTGGTVQASDSGAASCPERFYRALMLP
jgi:hypothetical protein